MELISIVDCDLCKALPPDQHVPEWELPLPETWGRLLTILVRRDWNDHCAVLARGLLADVAMQTLQAYVPRQGLAPAIPALAEALQRPGSAGWWQKAAHDLLIEYVGSAPERAKEVFEAIGGDTAEVHAVCAHCQRCLAQ